MKWRVVKEREGRYLVQRKPGWWAGWNTEWVTMDLEGARGQLDEIEASIAAERRPEVVLERTISY